MNTLRISVLLTLQMAIALFASSDSVGDENPVLWQQDFENRLPGEMPDGWGIAWGTKTMPPCDLFTISNSEHLGGSRSLLFERNAPLEAAIMYGICTGTPPIQSPLVKFSLFFMPVGSASETGFSFELRTTAHGKMAAIEFGARKVTLARGDHKKSSPLGQFELGQWNKISVVLPCDPEKQTGKASAVLETRNSDGSWKALSAPVDMELTCPIAKDKKILIMFNVPATKAPFKVYFDDMSIETYPKEQEK